MKSKKCSIRLKSSEDKVEVVDLYAKAVGLNGDRGAIVDLKETDPEGWSQTECVGQDTITDAYIWELHVEDFSSSKTSGISEKNRGKYLAFTEKNTHLEGDERQPTGLAYLKEQGINYVHLLPSLILIMTSCLQPTTGAMILRIITFQKESILQTRRIPKPAFGNANK